MKMLIHSEVHVPGLGALKHEHVQEFKDNSNVFGRALEYHEYMYKAFPKCVFKLLDAKEVE